MEVEIKLNEEEFDVLMQFVFVGNYVINGIREGETRIKKCDDVAEKLYRLQYEVVNKLSSEDAEENEYADLRDWAYDSVHEYMDDYEKDVFREKLSKWIIYSLGGQMRFAVVGKNLQPFLNQIRSFKQILHELLNWMSIQKL